MKRTTKHGRKIFRPFFSKDGDGNDNPGDSGEPEDKPMKTFDDLFTVKE